MHPKTSHFSGYGCRKSHHYLVPEGELIEAGRSIGPTIHIKVYNKVTTCNSTPKINFKMYPYAFQSPEDEREQDIVDR